jgi:hypothetical protein
MKVEGCAATSDTNVDIEIEAQNVYGATILGSFQLTFIVNDPGPLRELHVEDEASLTLLRDPLKAKR